MARDLKKMIADDLRTQTITLYARFRKEKASDEIGIPTAKIAKIILALKGLISRIYSGDEKILEDFDHVVWAKFPGYTWEAQPTTGAEPTLQMVAPARVVEMPAPAIAPLPAVEESAAAQTDVVDNFQSDLDFFASCATVRTDVKSIDFTDRADVFFRSDKFDASAQEVFCKAVRANPELLLSKGVREYGILHKDLKLMDFFVRRAYELKPNKTGLIFKNSQAGWVLQGAISAFQACAMIAETEEQKSDVRLSADKFFNGFVKETFLLDRSFFFDFVNGLGLKKPNPGNESRTPTRTASFPTAHEARVDKDGDTHQRPSRPRGNKLYKSHQDEGRPARVAANTHGRKAIPESKYVSPSERPLSQEERSRRNGPDVTLRPDPSRPIHHPEAPTGIPLEERFAEGGGVQKEGGNKIVKRTTDKTPPAHIQQWMGNGSDVVAEKQAPDFTPPPEWQEGEQVAEVAVVGIEPAPAMDFGPKLVKTVEEQPLNGFDHSAPPAAQPASEGMVQ